jgi:hypothetical protein
MLIDVDYKNFRKLNHHINSFKLLILFFFKNYFVFKSVFKTNSYTIEIYLTIFIMSLFLFIMISFKKNKEKIKRKINVHIYLKFLLNSVSSCFLL